MKKILSNLFENKYVSTSNVVFLEEILNGP